VALTYNQDNTFSGDNTLSGANTITGPTTISNTTTHSGALNVTGNTTTKDIDDAGVGVQIGSPTGGAKGAGSLNTEELYVQNNSVKTAVIECAHQTTGTTDGGTFTSGSWVTRDLNTTLYEYDADGAVAPDLANDRIDLDINGTYLIEGWANAVAVEEHQSRIHFYNGSSSSYSPGSAEYTLIAYLTSTPSRVSEIVTVTAAGSYVQIQHRCQTTRATDGLGRAGTGFGQLNLFAGLKVTRLI